MASATHSILMLVSATVGTAGAARPVPDGCNPGGRTFALSDGYGAADRVALEGSTDGGDSFTPVMVNGIAVVLTGAQPQVTLENNCEYYRTRRTAKAAGSTLATCGATFTETNASSASGGIYGDGSDGPVTISGTVTLTRDMYYTTLDVPTGTQINSKGYRIFATDYINISGGFIDCKGGDATTISGASSPAVLYGLDGGDGNTGGGAGNPGQTSFNLSLSIAHAGGAGGLGAGGAGGAASAGTIVVPARDLLSVISTEYLRSHGGGGGGGGGDASTGDGGGGGGGGGPIFLIAPTITNTGGMTVRGGNGSGSFTANAGGGGGGGAGSIFYVGENITNADASHNIAGGLGGAPGGSGTGVAGSAGTAGVIRTILVQ